MNWKKIVTHGICLSISQWAISIAQGFFAPGAGIVFSPYDLLSLVVCTAIFAHLAMRQKVRPFVHACLALAVYGVISLAFAAMLSGLLGSVPTELVALEWLILVVCMLAGVSIGNMLRRRTLDS